MPIRELRQQMNGGAPRVSKYRLELYIPGEDTRHLSVLCQMATFPTRGITPVQIFHKGRPFLLRGEMDFGNSVDLVFLETPNSSVRRVFDYWLKLVDDPNLNSTELGEFQTFVNDIAREVNSVVSLVNTVKSIKGDLGQVVDTVTGSGQGSQYPSYQTNMRVWKLNQNNEDVYGYEFQNAFINRISQEEFRANSVNEIQRINITIGYSEAIPIHNKNLSTLGKLTGTEITDQVTRVKNQF